MPIRIASLTQRIAKNGAMLHKATMDRIHSLGADHEPSEAEQALAEERRLLKEERAKRQARAQQPGPKALEKLVRTHHPEAKEKPKATKEAKEAKEPKDAKAGKHGPRAPRSTQRRRRPWRPRGERRRSRRNPENALSRSIAGMSAPLRRAGLAPCNQPEPSNDPHHHRL